MFNPLHFARFSIPLGRLLVFVGCSFFGAIASADYNSFLKSMKEEINIDDTKETWSTARSRQMDNNRNILVVCKVLVSAEHEWDAFRGPDLLVKMTLGPRRTRWRRGKENAYVSYISVPAVTLNKGDTVSIEVADRDILGDEHIGSDKKAFTGAFPIELSSEFMTANCRALPQSVVENRVAPFLDKAQDQLDRAKLVKQADPQKYGFGKPDRQITGAGTSIIRAAAWVGQRDDRVRALADGLAQLEKSWQLWQKEAVQAQLQQLPKKGDWQSFADGGVKLRVVKTLCGSDLKLQRRVQQRQCGVEVQVESTGPRNFRLREFAPLGNFKSLRLVLANGTTVPLRIAKVMDSKNQPVDSLLLKRGDRAVVILMASSSNKVPGSKRVPAMLLSRGTWLDRGEVHWLRL